MTNIKHKWALIISGIIIVLCISSFFIFKSYSNDTIQNNGNDKTSVSKASDRPKKSSKNKGGIFLQDSNNPDDIIAINPYGSKGIYKYRQNSKGKLYPEFKFYDGKLSSTKEGLSFIPNNSRNGVSPYSFTRNNAGNYIDNDSHKSYQKLDTVEVPQKNDETPKYYTLPNYNSSNKRTSQSVKTYDDYKHEILGYGNQPSYDLDLNDDSIKYKNGFIHLDNGDFLYPGVRGYLGYHFDSFDTTNFDATSYEHMPSNEDKVMYYKQNEQTTLSNNEVTYNADWVKDQETPMIYF